MPGEQTTQTAMPPAGPPAAQASRKSPSPARWAAAGALGGAAITLGVVTLIERAPMPTGPGAGRPPEAVSLSVPATEAAIVRAPVLSAPAAAESLAEPGPRPAFVPDTVAVSGGTPAAAPPQTASPAGSGVPGGVPEPGPAVAASPAPAATPTASAPTAEPSGVTRLNINTASRSELELLPGIGPTLAGRIIEFREREGPIRSLTHLTEVKGIGTRTAEKMSPYVRFE